MAALWKTNTKVQNGNTAKYTIYSIYLHVKTKDFSLENVLELSETVFNTTPPSYARL